MKGKQVKELLKQTRVKAAGAVLAALIAVGSIFAANYDGTSVPELVTYVDTTEVVSIEEEDVPLAEPTVTTSTKTTKSTKKIKMKKAATKTYTSKGSIKTKKSTKTQKTSKATTTTKTVTTTQTSKAYKKKSKVCTQTTTKKTTITKTVVVKAATKVTASATTASTEATTVSAANLTIEALAPKADSRVVYAWNTLGFKFVQNTAVSYSGLCDARTRTITLKSVTSASVNYHELGHFVAFVAGNADRTTEFQSIFNEEKANYTAYNKAYVLQSSSEYFAESYKDYVMTPSELKQSRPKTYAAIQAALAKITTAQVSKIATTYAAVWN